MFNPFVCVCTHNRVDVQSVYTNTESIQTPHGCSRNDYFCVILFAYISVYVFAHGCEHSCVSLQRRCMQPAARFEPTDPQTVQGPAPKETSLHEDTKEHDEEQEKERKGIKIAI